MHELTDIAKAVKVNELEIRQEILKEMRELPEKYSAGIDDIIDTQKRIILQLKQDLDLPYTDEEQMWEEHYHDEAQE